MKIVTLSLCPAFDMHLQVENFKPYRENLAELTDYEAGGKGINIARTLTANGIEQRAVVLLGEDSKSLFESELKRSGINYSSITVPGRIRENITLHSANSPETRISFKGFSADDEIIVKVENELATLQPDDIVTLTGRNPEGLNAEKVIALCKRLTAKGIRLVIDSQPFSLNDLIEIKPWLIKPNQEEISRYGTCESVTFEDIKKTAASLHSNGIANVMVSLGSEGAYLVCDEGEFFVKAPKVNAVSTIGAGDSAVSGFIVATIKGKSAKDSLRYAVAYGTAACLSSGTKPPMPNDIKEILKRI